ncbi:LytTR family transcriptional regulator DNA-binding domain-containing protein [Macrococcus brunensis]|uniref:LytTR family transcriptional regulator DNA-binding domain-containing protein n=1 Tax=Macrococcus brunensis TaxID=198483 RepID=UPI001EEF8FB9|nr:LytTR family transcriptional regulator DNA-binding domain-containing protein [Macrococcus brunensis]ULG74302.1 LytTR family transcriptional regulator DNA-binding domain-containing protein [Macrococcus brunensis]
MKILIVDDEPLARNELKFLIEQLDDIDLVDEADCVEDTLTALLSERYDLLFLDINLIDESGLDLAEKINKMKRPPQIIFATAHDTFAVKAFELNALDYVLKPFESARIEQAVAKARTEKQQITAISIQSDDKIYVLKFDEIVALYVEEGQLHIATVDRQYLLNEPLSNYEKKLPDYFMRIHRSNIINTRHIISAEHWFNHTYQVKLTGNIKLQVSRSYIRAFKEEIGLI